MMCLCFYSDGGGRSGVFLSIDANMELMEEEDSFDVYGYLKMLRQSRKGLIETVVSEERPAYCVLSELLTISYQPQSFSMERTFLHSKNTCSKGEKGKFTTLF